MSLTLSWIVALPVCSEMTLYAEIGAHLRDVRGVVECTAHADEVLMATYPGVLATDEGIDDVNRQWFYPDGFEPAWMRLAAGGEVVEARGPWVAIPSRSGFRLAVEFSTHIPTRNGVFGTRDGVAYLLGGWHPLPGDGEHLEDRRIHFRVRVPNGFVGFVGKNPLKTGSPRVVEGTHVGRFLPILLAPAARVVRWQSAIGIVPENRTGRVRPGVRLRELGDGPPFGEGIAELGDTLDQGHFWAQQHGLGAAGGHLLVVRAPLRERLVEPFDGGLAVSDRAFQVLPLERLLKFHRLSVWRHQLAALLLGAVHRTGALLPVRMVADFVGTALSERLGRERYGEREFAPDILETFAVIPEIDSLIYAPQISFVSTYFSAIDETPARRWHVDDFFHGRPRGKLLYEKLVDRLGKSAVHQLVDDFLAGSATLSALVEGRGVPVADLLAWVGPYPRVDYALGQMEATEDGGLTVEVRATGPDTGRVVEPVTVEVETDDGEVHRAQRLGPGWVHVSGAAKVDRVELDPAGRLVELHRPPGKGARFNNRDPPRWRFLLNNVAGLVAVTNRELSLAVDFSLRRIHDLRYRMDFFALYGPTSVGGAVTGSIGFGKEITPLKLASRAGLSVAYERLRDDGGSAVAGNQVSGSVFFRYDDRLTPYWSYEGKGLNLRMSGAVGRGVNGATYAFFRPGVSAFGILPLAFGHALVGRLRGDVTLGEPPPQDLLPVGDLYLAGRGFERDDARGRVRLVSTVEYRHVWFGDGGANLAGVATWTRLEGAVFADALFLDVQEPVGCGRRGFFDVGYGLRLIGDILGISPAAITIDVGVPLGGRCQPANGRIPVAIYLGFVQSLASF